MRALALPLLLLPWRCCRSTVVISRGVNPYGLLEEETEDPCNFVGEIVIHHATSASPNDRFYETAVQMDTATVLTVDKINTQRCGVHLSTGNYSLRLISYADDNLDAIARHMVYQYQVDPTPHFWTVGYSSSLTQQLAPIAKETNTLLMATGASDSAIYKNNTNVFGTFPPGDSLFYWALYATTIKGARTIAHIQEEGTTSLCANVPPMATNRFHMNHLGSMTVPQNATLQHYITIAQTIQDLNPDVMITCVDQPQACAQWIAAMRTIRWQPKAQIFSSCIGTSTLEQLTGDDLHYMMGVNLWDPALPPIPDSVTQWTPQDFAQLFEQAAFRNASSYAPSQSAAISILVQAMERADSYTNLPQIQRILQEQTFTTVFGPVDFDDNGQSQVPSLLLQYDDTTTLHVMYPRDKASANNKFDMVYPLPTWEYRDCLLQSTCTDQGNCNVNGSCVCPEPMVAIGGSGINATCRDPIPTEDRTYIQPSLKYIGYTLVAIQLCLSTGFLIWTYHYRHRGVVRLSQPIFLGVIALGAAILSLSIIPMATETGYRYEIDPITQQELLVPNPDIGLVDAACMGWLWLAAFGFAMIYAGLFAKIWRIKRILDSAANMRRKKVNARDVVSILIVLLLLEGIILLSWQFVSPLKWEREIVLTDQDGYTLQSVGGCNSEHYLEFGTALAVLNGGCLVYALILAYTTRSVPTQLSEGKWIALSVASTFQILLLSGPILIIARDNASAQFFLQSALVFLVSSTSTMLIFGPKFHRLHFVKDDPTGRTRGNRSSIQVSGLDLPSSGHNANSWLSGERGNPSSRYSSFTVTPGSRISSFSNNHSSAEFGLPRKGRESASTAMSTAATNASPLDSKGQTSSAPADETERDELLAPLSGISECDREDAPPSSTVGDLDEASAPRTSRSVQSDYSGTTGIMHFKADDELAA